MKKSQSTLFIISALAMVLMLGFLIYASMKDTNVFYNQESKKVLSLSEMRGDINDYVNSCIKDSVKMSIEETGIREETLEKYRELTSSKIKSCTSYFFAQLKNQEYSIKEGDIKIDVLFSTQTISVDILYPIVVEYNGQKIEFKEFNYVFDRSVSISIPGGVTDREIELTSADGKAQLTIPKGVKITDENGNPVDYIGMRVEDLHFDGLENKYVVGQTVYDNFPDGLSFSEPVKLSIEFRDADITANYTKENIRISYWSNESGIWYALNTKIEKNRAIANITHFSHYSTVFVRDWIIRNLLFKQRFYPFGGCTVKDANEEDKCKNIGQWLIGGTEPNKGTATIQPSYFASSYTSSSADNPNTWFLYSTDIFDISPPQIDDGFNAVVREASKRGDYNNNNNYPDFRETLNNANFAVIPILKYGYFPDPSNPSEGDFINCEEDDTTDGIHYYLDKDTYPYFNACDLNCRSDLKCMCKGEVDCVSSCNNIQTCFGNSNGKLCIPNNDVRDDNTVSCTGVFPNTENPDNCETKIFGWHNYQCAGGIVRPAEGEEAADFIVFDPNGNAVLTEGTLTVLELPTINSFAAIDLESFEKFLVDGTTEIIHDDGNKLESYYCQVVPFTSSKYDGSSLRITKDTRIKKIDISDTLKDKLGYDNKDTIAAWGIYGVDVIKKTNHDYAKIDLHAECRIFWAFEGSGFDSNPSDAFTKVISDKEIGLNLIPTDLTFTFN